MVKGGRVESLQKEAKSVSSKAKTRLVGGFFRIVVPGLGIISTINMLFVIGFIGISLK